MGHAHTLLEKVVNKEGAGWRGVSSCKSSDEGWS